MTNARVSDDRAPVALAVAPNGGRRMPGDHPALPLTAAELAHTAAECLAAGASMIHLHVRDAEGRHVLDPDAFRAAIAAIRAVVGDRLVIQITSEAVGRYDAAAQIAAVKAVRPEAVSLALRELAPDAGSEAGFAGFLQWLKQENITPQIILYSADEAVRFAELGRRGLLPWDRVPVLFVLGRYSASQESAPANLLPFLDPPVPPFAHWMVCAFGRREAECVTAGAVRGGHVRVGFENNLCLPDGTTAPDNAALVRATAQIIRAAGRSLATANQLRSAWNAL